MSFSRTLLGAGALALFFLPACALLKAPSSNSSNPAAETQASPTEPEKKPTISGNRLAKSIYVGQVYPSGSVYLDVTDDREEGKKRWPKTVKIYPMEVKAGGTPEPMSATLIGPLEQVYPPEAEGIAEKSSECSAPAYHQDPSLSYNEGDIKDYFDRGVSDNCSGYNVAKYWTSQKVTKSFPVFAVSDFDPAAVDYSVKGAARPLTTSERREVSQFHFADDPDQDNSRSHFLESATQLVAFHFPAVGLSARLSTFVNERGDQRTRSYVLDVLDGRRRIKKRHLRTLFKGNL